MSTQSAEWITAARVLRCIGFGARGPDVDSILSLGETASYVDDIANADFASDPGALATPIPDIDVPDQPKNSGEAERRRHATAVKVAEIDLINWWIRRMVAVRNPANEKLTFVWHNHFATSVVKVGFPQSMANQNQRLRELCLGDFERLAKAMLTDAAMIKWLDGQDNKASAPNENLAREFLELFALGHGNGYSENDVREGARALTGWTIDNGVHARLSPEHHDYSTKSVLGSRGRIGLDRFCELVVAHPNSAGHVATKLWKQLASDRPPSDATLSRLCEAYGPKRDLRELTKAILTDPSFLGDSATLVASPVDWMIGLLRAVGSPLDNQHQLKDVTETLKSLGQLPFRPPDVGGWPQGQSWLPPSAVNVRLRAAKKIVKNGDTSLVDEAAEGDRLDATGYLIGVGAWTDRSANALRQFVDDPTRLVAAAVCTPEYLTI